MKDGRTHLAHKAEHAIALETGAIVGVTVQDADEGDTSTMQQTLPEAADQLEAVAAVTEKKIAVIEEFVADKGYHGRTSVLDLETLKIRTYISEPDRGRQSWADQEAERDAVYANRRRIRARAANGSSADAGNCWNVRARICTRPVDYGAPTYAATRTC